MIGELLEPIREVGPVHLPDKGLGGGLPVVVVAHELQHRLRCNRQLRVLQESPLAEPGEEGRDGPKKAAELHALPKEGGLELEGDIGSIVAPQGLEPVVHPAEIREAEGVGRVRHIGSVDLHHVALEHLGLDDRLEARHIGHRVAIEEAPILVVAIARLIEVPHKRAI